MDLSTLLTQIIKFGKEDNSVSSFQVTTDNELVITTVDFYKRFKSFKATIFDDSIQLGEQIDLANTKIMFTYNIRISEMDNIKDIIRSIQNGNIILVNPDESDDGLYINPEINLSDVMECLFCNNLINKNGRCNWDNIYELKEIKGVDIFPGDKDSYGWLVGCVSIDIGQNRDVLFCYG